MNDPIFWLFLVPAGTLFWAIVTLLIGAAVHEIVAGVVRWKHKKRRQANKMIETVRKHVSGEPYPDPITQQMEKDRVAQSEDEDTRPAPCYGCCHWEDGDCIDGVDLSTVGKFCGRRA